MGQKKFFSCELALIIAIVLNSFCLSLIAKSDLGISTLSSVPLVLSKIFTFLSFGTWNFIIQSLSILILVAVTKHFKIGYLISFLIASIFGILLDINKVMMLAWPDTFSWRTLYFLVGFLLMNVGASLFIKCMLPALPFDTFVRDMTEHLKVSVKKVKTSFDLICVLITLTLSLSILGYIYGVGIGTIIGALFTGTITNRICDYLENRYTFQIKFTFVKKISKML